MHKPDFSYDFKDMLLGRGAWENVTGATPGLEGEDIGHFRKLVDKAGSTEGDNPTSVDLFLKAVSSEADFADGSKRSNQRRYDTRLLCRIYTKLKARGKGWPEAQSIEELISSHKNQQAKPMIYVGGPFSEAVQIITELFSHNVGPVIAMAGASHGGSNLFANQFNIHVDMDSAETILNMAKRREINLNLIPTECAKGTPYQLTWEELEQIDGLSQPIIELYNQWSPRSPVVPFDILAAMAVTTDLYQGMLKPVKCEVDAKGTFVFSQENGEAQPGPGLKMFWNEPKKVTKDGGTVDLFDQNDLMLERKPKFLEEFKRTLTPPNLR